MYDRKTVRRRRAVLGLLVAGALILLTAYFGESAGGGLHSVQRGVFSIVSPIQDGASRALKPIRDAVGWVGDTFSAKGQLADLRKQRDQLRQNVASGEEALRENARLQGLLNLDTTLNLKQYSPVSARVIGVSPTVWFATVNIDSGTGDGVRTDMPVINDAGLVGKVSVAASDAAKVSLITDSSVQVSVRVAQSGVSGLVQASVGNPDDLLMRYTSKRDRVLPGQRVVTAGTTSSRLESPYPPGILVGTVTHVDDAGTDAQVVHVVPAADMHRLEFVQVLTRKLNGNRP